MADWETNLISKCVQVGGVEKLISSGVQTRHFSSSQNKDIWNWLINHIKKYKVSPSPDLVHKEFSDYEFPIVTEPLEFVRDKFIETVKRRESIEKLRDLSRIIDENNSEKIMNIDELFLDAAKDLTQIVPSYNVSRMSEMQARIQLYRQRKAEGKMVGIPFGIPPLDELTLGLQSHEYVTIAGFAGIGKSTLALLLMMNQYVDGYTPMLISLEMDEEQVFRKLDAMAVGLRQSAIKAMELHPNDMKKWEHYAEKILDAPNDIIVVDINFGTAEKVYAEAARWNPDVLAVDYLQLLEAPKHIKQSWERVGYLSKEMKMIARQLKVPVYGLSQTNSDSADEGAKLSNLSMSRQIAAHSDIVLGLNQDESMEAQKQMEIRVLKNRDGPKKVNPGILMLWDHDTCDYREWRVEDAYNRRI